MAPINPDQALIHERLQNTLHDLYTALLQTATFDPAGRPSSTTLSTTLATLDDSLRGVHELASSSTHPSPGVPETLVHYVENGRNPDIYTREFVELVRRMNQLMRGKMGGFRQFRDVLGREIEGAMEECRGDVERVMGGRGGGRWRIWGVGGGGGGGWRFVEGGGDLPYQDG
ncbi:transcription factor subunit Med10 of mediator complex-domain-containing protein [Schizothecium vesticola]|uniref:Mediator of RNA polymerase II transcription subunit 10 n=1 Tax=Schizothecium vesticola TaxID=314040 RepID=A0AA40BQP9_9PEZI|nr:transcription factor subunit Med10 of mediator complex-domain-containing protein [Schizothecium vesticola]